MSTADKAMPYGPETTVCALASDSAARSIVEKYLPGIFEEPELYLLPFTTLAELPRFVRGVGDPPVDVSPMWYELARLPTQQEPHAVLRPALPSEGQPYPDRASAILTAATGVEQWGVAELAWEGPSYGNPFIDVELEVTWRRGTGRVGVYGFYDGDGIYRARFHPPEPGLWAYQTRSNVDALDGLSGTVEVTQHVAQNHGRVVVDGTFHFAYADGAPYLPLGTTAYGWIHQSIELQDATVQTLAGSGFTKLRMCVFPKSYHYNSNEPALYPYERAADGGWDFSRFNVIFFQRLERRIAQLDEIGIEADLILFHPYDRWGFSQMPDWADRLYVAYLVRRLAAFRNVWWALANEYDFMNAKIEQDWEGIAEVIQREDHVGHLTSIHNGFVLYDHTRPWVTHCSIQSGATETVGEWRARYHKPVVIDEAGYEGNLEFGWGNLTAEELVRRCWDGAVRGAYVNHGETYHDDTDLVWWSKGGELRGESAERIRFLASIIAETPSGRFEPLPSDLDVPCGGDSDHRILYLGAARPLHRTVTMPAGDWMIDIIDTWAMTIDTVPGTHHGRVTVQLPERQYIAIRLRAVHESAVTGDNSRRAATGP